MICFQFFLKCKRKYWKRKGLEGVDSVIIDYACCLALAPADRFEEGLRIIENKIDEHDIDTQTKLTKFVKYLWDQWWRYKNKLCVGHLPHRTNNLCESLNSTLKDRLGGRHPGIWKFLSMKQIFTICFESFTNIN